MSDGSYDEYEFEEFVEDVLSLVRENLLKAYREEGVLVEDIIRLHQNFHWLTEAFPELKWARDVCSVFAVSGLLAMLNLLKMAYFGLRYFIEQVDSYTKPRKRESFLENVYLMLHNGLSKVVHGEVEPSGIADYRDASVVAVWLSLSLIKQWNPNIFQESTVQARLLEYDEEEERWLFEELIKVLQKWGIQNKI